MKTCVAIVLTASMLALVGCQPTAESKQEWYSTRSKILCGVAEEHLRTGQLDDARARAEEAKALDASNYRAWLLLAKIYIEQGQYPLAINDLTSLLEKAPDSSELHYLLGVAQEKQGELDEALASYQKAYELGPDTDLAPVVAATEVLVQLNRVDEAYTYIKGYMHLCGSDVAVFELAGRLAMMLGKYDEAVQHFEQAHDLDCKNVRYEEALARAQYQAGQPVAALETLTDLRDKPNYVPSSWVWTMMGDCYLGKGRPAEARRAFQSACDADNADAGNWANLAKASLAMRDQKGAILASHEALQREPGNLEATITLGYALIRDGQYDEAITQLGHGVKAHPDNGPLLCLLGRAHQLAGSSDAAARCFDRARQVDPDGNVTQQLLSAFDARQVSYVGR